MVSWINKINVNVDHDSFHAPKFQSQESIDLSNMINTRYKELVSDNQESLLSHSDLETAFQSSDPYAKLKGTIPEKSLDILLKYYGPLQMEEVENFPTTANN